MTKSECAVLNCDKKAEWRVMEEVILYSCSEHLGSNLLGPGPWIIQKTEEESGGYKEKIVPLSKALAKQVVMDFMYILQTERIRGNEKLENYLAAFIKTYLNDAYKAGIAEGKTAEVQKG